MALVDCPDCQSRVSDKASACIHCGCPSSEFSVGSKVQEPKTSTAQQSLDCFECKAPISVNDTFCANCNTPNSQKIAYSEIEKQLEAQNEMLALETEAQRETRELKQKLFEASKVKQPMTSGQMFLCIVGALLFFVVGIPIILAFLNYLYFLQ